MSSAFVILKYPHMVNTRQLVLKAVSCTMKIHRRRRNVVRFTWLFLSTACHPTLVHRLAVTGCRHASGCPAGWQSKQPVLTVVLPPHRDWRFAALLGQLKSVVRHRLGRLAVSALAPFLQGATYRGWPLLTRTAFSLAASLGKQQCAQPSELSAVRLSPAVPAVPPEQP